MAQQYGWINTKRFHMPFHAFGPKPRTDDMVTMIDDMERVEFLPRSAYEQEFCEQLRNAPLPYLQFRIPASSWRPLSWP